MTLRDQFAVAVAPAILNLQLVTGKIAMSMAMGFNETGEPTRATAQMEGTVNYDEVAIESYMLADALLRVSVSSVVPRHQDVGAPSLGSMGEALTPR